MVMARIFTPIRNLQPAREGRAIAPDPSGKALGGGARTSRVEAQPVTNTSPPGAPLLPAAATLPAARPLPTPAQEEDWMALLELVFAVTQWPDAE